MTYRGRIKNGVAVLDTPGKLPEGTRVRVEVEPAGSEFWGGKTVEELARDQGIQPIDNLADLAIDWPEEESVDEFLALVREVRH
ncbi:MAG: hypothetical protein ABSH08_09635 [Tepidisphaeraceae bacterium]|jgi:hypothetical protein